uniref:Uncharacterized protein n=1 Tax=Strongyloides venezuelensis TaxID=75913 RepID=A0A0K0F2W1_STRVS
MKERERKRKEKKNNGDDRIDEEESRRRKENVKGCEDEAMLTPSTLHHRNWQSDLWGGRISPYSRLCVTNTFLTSILGACAWTP